MAKGGTSVKVCKQKCNTNLHQHWDDALGNSTKIESVKKAAVSLPPADPKLVAVMDEKSWVQESFELAKSEAYVEPIGVNDGPFAVNEKYRLMAKRIAAERVALAGVWLANLLNGAPHNTKKLR